MARRPSADFRERLVAAVGAGLPRGEAAQRFRVSPRTIDRWLARHRQGEALAERPRSGRAGSVSRARRRCALVAAQPGATLPAHAARLAAEIGIRFSPSHLGRLLRRLELPLTNNP